MTDLLRCTLPAPQPELAERLSSGFLRDAVLGAISAGRAQRRAAGKAMARWFRQERRLGAKDRPLVAEAAYAFVRYENLLIRAGARDDEELVAGVARLLAGDRLEGLAPSSPEEDYATALGLDWRIAQEWLEVLGVEGACELGRALSERAPTVVRANRLRCRRDELAERLRTEGVDTTPTTRAPDGLILLGRANLVGLSSFKDGWFEVQDESSQLLVEAMPVEPGMPVIDVCAGAGGKALALAAKGARVRAWDPRGSALDELHKRAVRAGAEIEITDDLGTAPLVLIDAPCTSTGRLRRDPALRWGLEVGAWLDTQRELLAEGGGLVAPGGRIFYATCSLLREENAHELAGAELDDREVLWPHRGGTDGFTWSSWKMLSH